MLSEIYPRDHARFTSLPLLGPHLEGFVSWLLSHGYCARAAWMMGLGAGRSMAFAAAKGGRAA